MNKADVLKFNDLELNSLLNVVRIDIKAVKAYEPYVTSPENATLWFPMIHKMIPRRSDRKSLTQTPH